MAKALVLLSGGLDSLLAAKVLMEQGVEVTGVSFKSYFFNTAKAKVAAEQLGIKLIEVDFSEEHLAMVKNPKHGYGKNLNPCIDCHAMMLKGAREIMEKPPLPPSLKLWWVNNLPLSKGENNKTPSSSPLSGGKFNFVATGEVLGERPMSQNAEALKIVEKESDLTGRLIRPLSAKLLDESLPEKAGLINRKRLMAISGRSRKPQLALVNKYGIKEYSNPGGGCLLTDPAFSEKLMKMFEYWPEGGGNDIELIKWGRIFWLKDEKDKNVLLIMGRDEKDNKQLEKLAKPGDALIGFSDLVAGPTSLVRMKNVEFRIKNEIQEINVPEELKMSGLKLGEKKSNEEIIKIALLLTGYYAVKARGKKVKLEIKIKK